MLVKSLLNKVIIVTGGSGGIGSAVVNRLLDCGAFVVSVYFNNRPFGQSGENVICFEADLTATEEWERLISFTQKQYGKIDALINCTGYLEPGNFSSIEEDKIKKMIKINFVSVIIGIHKILEIFKKQNSGHIISIGSLGGLVPMPYSSVYCASKFALRGFTFSLAEELKGTGIDISLVSPGSVITKMLNYEALDKNTSIAFVGRPVSPAEVSNAVINVILKPQIELIVPGSQSVASKILSFSPFVFSNLYWILQKIGITRKRSYMNRYCNFNSMEGR